MEQNFVYYIKVISEKIKARCDENVSEYSLTSQQAQIIGFIFHSEDHKTYQKDIEKFLNCSHATTRGILKRLENKNYISLKKDDEDSRQVVVSLNKEYEEIAKESFIKNKKMFDDLLIKSNITQKDVEFLLDILRRLDSVL